MDHLLPKQKHNLETSCSHKCRSSAHSSKRPYELCESSSMGKEDCKAERFTDSLKRVRPRRYNKPYLLNPSVTATNVNDNSSLNPNESGVKTNEEEPCMSAVDTGFGCSYVESDKTSTSVENDDHLNADWFTTHGFEETTEGIFEEFDWFNAQFDSNSEVFSDGTQEESDELKNDDESEQQQCQFGNNEPIYSGHFLPLRVSMLLIWLYAITHGINGTQFADLLTLINLHLLYAHPALKSFYMFKKYFSVISGPVKKHYFCSYCLTHVEVDVEHCPNASCLKDLREKKAKGYFLELSVESQLQNMFKNPEFLKLLQHRRTRIKKTEANIEDVYDSELYKNLCKNNGPLSENYPYNLSFIVNTDGIPIFKSSKISLWPIYLMINELPFKYRKQPDYMIMCGLWFGSSKPFMNSFMTPLYTSMNNLEKGIPITINGKSEICRAFALGLSADLPARSITLNMNQFNGDYSCVKCLQKGENFRTESGGNIRIFPYKQDDPKGPPRKTEMVKSDAYNAFSDAKLPTCHGIKGPSYFLMMPKFDIVNSTTIDYMHCVLLGITRLLVKLWFTSRFSKLPFSIYGMIDVVDSRISKIKPTHTISRTPRTISEHFKFWKAAELRSWLLYYSIPVIRDMMKPTYLYHYAAFVHAVFLLSQDSISKTDLAESEKLLLYFVYMMAPLYGDKYVTLNVHQLVHMTDCVRNLGPLWAHSCFPFENENGKLLQLFHGTKYVDMQIANAVNILQTLPTLAQSVPKESPAFEFVSKLMKLDIQNKKGKFYTYFLGAGYTKTLSDCILGQVTTLLGHPVRELVFYKRAVLRKIVYHSCEYSRVTVRNSYTVKYTDGTGHVRYGFAMWYAEHKGSPKSTSQRCIAICCIQRFEECDVNIVIQPQDNHTDFCQNDNILSLRLSQVHLLQSAGEVFDVVLLQDIIALCVCVEVDQCLYVCEEPNTQEVNI